MGPIIVATDFSPVSDGATDAAAELARASGSPLHVVHAWQPTSLVAMDAALVASPATVARIASERQGAVDAVIARYRAKGVEMVGHILEGDTAVELARYAREHGAAMIVVGTSAPTGIRAVLLGSVADAITRKAPCPVLVVRHGPPISV